jgi:death on curing protein
VKRPKWLAIALVTAIHDEAIYEFGGLSGIRDTGLLESALDRPRNRLAYQPKTTVFELAASLCFGLAKNHPFVDGNKRTALLAARAFLFVNGYLLEPAEDDEVLTIVAVAEDSVSEQQLAEWMQRNSTRDVSSLAR